jgi:hypothetical protein
MQQGATGAAVLATRPVAGSGPGGDSPGWRRVCCHPVVISALATAVGAVVWVTVFPRVGTDLSAALARAGWASRYPGSAYLFSWYGGIHPASYSLLAPYVLAIAGTHLAMAVAAVISAALLTWLLVRHQVPRPRAAALWVAVALWTELSAGRAAFTLGLAAALGCAVAVDTGRPRNGADAGRLESGADASRPRRGTDAGRLQSGADAGRPRNGADAGRLESGADAGRPGSRADAGRLGSRADAGRLGSRADAGRLGSGADAGRPGSGADASRAGSRADASRSRSGADTGHPGSRADASRPRRRTRLLAAAVLALLTCLLSPVAALFLGVLAAVFAVTRHWPECLVVAVPAGLPLGAMAWFSDGGVQPMGVQNWLPPLLAAAGVLVLIPRRWRMVRIGAVVYGLGVILACAVPTLVGSNVARLGELLTGPLLAGFGSARHRWLLVLGLTAAAAWQVAQPAADLAQGNAQGNAPQTAALVRELGALHADTARVEAVPQYGHWESQELAFAVPLARGWERQVDTERNPLFYSGTLTPSAYHAWLRYNAVRYVAISAATPDPAAVAEATTVRDGQPWLVPVWHNAFWQLYRVTGTSPLASPPATITNTTPAQITLRMSWAGSTVVRVRWSPLLRAAGAVLAQHGPWTSLTVRQPGTYRLSAPY